MKYIRQFLIIVGIAFAGEILHQVLPLPIPASIYGILILFLALEFHVLPLHAVRETSYFLVEIMPILFIPAAVGVMDIWNVIQSKWLSYLVITVLTTVIVMVVAGHVTQFVIAHSKGEEDEEDA